MFEPREKPSYMTIDLTQSSASAKLWKYYGYSSVKKRHNYVKFCVKNDFYVLLRNDCWNKSEENVYLESWF